MLAPIAAEPVVVLFTHSCSRMNEREETVDTVVIMARALYPQDPKAVADALGMSSTT